MTKIQLEIYCIQIESIMEMLHYIIYTHTSPDLQPFFLICYLTAWSRLQAGSH